MLHFTSSFPANFETINPKHKFSVASTNNHVDYVIGGALHISTLSEQMGSTG